MMDFFISKLHSLLEYMPFLVGSVNPHDPPQLNTARIIEIAIAIMGMFLAMQIALAELKVDVVNLKANMELIRTDIVTLREENKTEIRKLDDRLWQQKGKR